jgi:uncharacterized protein (TIGR00299 family) protein
MKTLYFDCFSGISGDMFLSALLDLGLPREEFLEALKKIPLSGYDIVIRKESRNQIQGTRLIIEAGEGHHHRGLSDFKDLVRASDVSPGVREKAEALFTRLVTIEAEIHQKPVDEVSLHEVGSVDSIIDIMGSLIAMEMLAVDKVYASPLHVGSGFVKAAHGLLPVPAPATAALLKGVPVFSRDVKGELVTPTGALLITAFADSFGPIPQMDITGVGYGVGTRTFEELPNLLRVFSGTRAAASRTARSTEVVVLEANMDDQEPFISGYVMERLLSLGALDVFYTPVTMKKNRPGILLSVLVHPDKQEAIIREIFRETTTLGIRLRRLERRELDRTFEKIKTPFGDIRVKVSFYDNRRLNAVPEYEDLRQAALKAGVPLKVVRDEVQALLRQGKTEPADQK